MKTMDKNILLRLSFVLLVFGLSFNSSVAGKNLLLQY